MATGQARHRIFCICAFIWRPTREGLLNPTKPTQNYYFFFGNFFQIKKKSVIEYSFEIFIFHILEKFRPKPLKLKCGIITGLG